MKKVLVIEDNADLLENISELLSLSNYTVLSANNGVEGIRIAINEKPDLVICDIMMPQLDGYGVFHAIQRHEDLQQIPFIFLTAKSDSGEVRKAMSLGADDYIMKPFDQTDLLSTVENRLKIAEKRNHFIEEKFKEHHYQDEDSNQALQKFISDRDSLYFKKKQQIYKEGYRATKLFYVLKGKVKIFKINESGKELIVRIVGSQEFFGLAPLFENSVYKENAEAVEETEIIALPKKEFEELILSHPQVSKKFINMLAMEVAEKEEQLVHVAYNSLRKKVATALLMVYEKYKDDHQNCSIQLSRENLAALAGTATESMIRTLTEFKSEKLIDIHDGRINILNVKKLEKMVN
ncbi:MAG TPA: response regulator [Emticicia sp.]